MENYILTPVIEARLQEINNTPYYWASINLPEHADLPNFNRKLVVSGFNSPDLEVNQDERFFITVKQIFINKETGKIFKVFNAPQWEIYAHTWSYLRNEQFQVIEVDKQIFDENNELISTEISKIQVSTIKYLKWLLLNRKAHLVDLFNLYLSDFAAAKIEELNKL